MAWDRHSDNATNPPRITIIYVSEDNTMIRFIYNGPEINTANSAGGLSPRFDYPVHGVYDGLSKENFPLDSRTSSTQTVTR